MTPTSATTVARPPIRRWRLPLRFSLRLALLGLTAFAIGFPIWYRWPYEEAAVVETPRAAITEHRTVTTWQRQWGGGRKKHGRERLYCDGILTSVTTYREGAEDGPFTSYHVTGGVQVQGQFVEGTRTGAWTCYDREGRVEAVERWEGELLDGDYEVHMPNRPVQHLQFSQGRLRAVNGKPATSRLMDLFYQPDSALPDHVRAELSNPTQFEFVETPLCDAVIYLSDYHGLRIVLDPALPERQAIVTAKLEGTNLISGLTLLTSQTDLAADFRYGCVWITTPADSRADWHDPTGVSDLKPPQGSQLARSWVEELAMSFVEAPLANVLKYLEQSLAIEIDDSALVAAGVAQQPVKLHLHGLSFPDVLGMLLYQTHLRCRLVGETIVIEP